MQKDKNCLNCEKVIKITTHYDQKYCSKICDRADKSNILYKSYLENQNDYCYIRNMKFIKQHILIEQNNCCDICKELNIWEFKVLIFILDHIDGDASNNSRENLRLVCPNCDSQLDTYKSKNKNSARKDRYKK